MSLQRKAWNSVFWPEFKRIAACDEWAYENIPPILWPVTRWPIAFGLALGMFALYLCVPRRFLP